MNFNGVLASKKVGFIGVGNMAQAILRAMLETNTLKAEQVVVYNRSPQKLQKLLEKYPIIQAKNNEEVVELCDVIFLGVKPQDLSAVLEPLAPLFGVHHTVISMAAGFPLDKLKKILKSVDQLVRIMPNTPAKIGQAVVGYCLHRENFLTDSVLRALMQPLGYLVKLEEGDAFEALTVSCGSGIAFVYELMQYWQSWIEDRGIDSETAKKMTVHTFLGAANLAARSQDLTLEELQSQVVSKKGVSQAGLESMRSLALEQILSSSFEKAAIRDRELSKM